MARWIALLALCVVGCSPTRSRSPQEVTQRYVAAVKQGDCRAAYRLMSRSYRQKTLLQDFCAGMKSFLSDPRRALLLADRTAETQHVRAELDMSAPATSPVRLELKDGHWVIASGVLGFYSQMSPRAALLTFIIAFRNNRYDILYELMPSRDRSELNPQALQKLFSETKRRKLIADRIAEIEPHLERGCERAGNSAHLSYGSREVRFVLEDGRWRILDLD